MKDFETDVTRPADDGRNIDERLGILAGEGSHQRVRALAEEGPHPEAVPRADSMSDEHTYYGLPVLKETVWEWPIPAYFYIGGVAGASSALAAASLLRKSELGAIVRAGRGIAFAGAGISAVLLIKDLGRPMRFLYMLRVFRPSSPMNVGTWILSAFGAFSFGAIALPGRLGDASGALAGVFGLPLASYTAVLVANTAVPLWQQVRNSLPVLFVASAASSASAVFELLDLSPAEARVVRRFSLAAKCADLAAGFAVEREANAIARVGKPLRESALWTAAKLCTALSLAVTALPRKPRWLRIAGGIAGTLGGLATRFGVFQAGRVSARDARATFEQQRAGMGGAEQLAGASGPAGVLRREGEAGLAPA